ncbi:glycosyltransferase family 25 protein [Hyphomicrobium sp.]|uniref:glycosyltransferase family 25 protein n=1 Tax=Hyphomicrobium sp. TaxID=82 RepID=UPI000FBBB2B9|nr:glycosyltransferase family 25 protein [Hyphomicrobium sp.]RUO98258.1 MAG: glycosyltransferase family 25 protein [Hyphomicrobium sp.]
MSNFSTPTFYINLDRDVSRRTRLEEELASVCLHAERISAVDGCAVPDWLESFYDHRMSAGETGCSASHLVIYRMIVERGLPYALILEDDARLEPDCLRAIQAALKMVPRDWDIIRLIETSSRALQRLVDLGQGKSLVRYLRIPRSTTGLVVSQSGARKLLTPRLIKEPIDVEIRWPWQLDLNVYGIDPPPVTQASGIEVETTIQARSRPKKNNQLQRMFFNIRKMGLGPYLSCCLGLEAIHSDDIAVANTVMISSEVQKA